MEMPKRLYPKFDMGSFINEDGEYVFVIHTASPNMNGFQKGDFMIYILTSWGRWDDEVLNRKFSTEEEAVSVMKKEYNIWNASKNTENECTRYYAKIIEGDDIYF